MVERSPVEPRVEAKMRYLGAACLIFSLAAAQVVDSVIQSFQEVQDTYTCFNSCAVKKLPGLADGLQWNNLYVYSGKKSFDGYVEGLVPPEWEGTRDVYYGRFKNPNKTATVTSLYSGSCVTDWSLERLEFGCSALQNATISVPGGSPSYYVGELYANCSLHLEGFDHRGRCVGHEHFLYQGGLGGGSSAYQYYFLKYFDTSAKGGLKGKRFQTLKMTAVLESTAQTSCCSSRLLGDINFGIDQFKYTVHNRTNCV